MTNDWYTADNAHVLKAAKMANWRHLDAKLEAANVQKMDEFIAGRLFEPVGIAAPMATGASYLPTFNKVTQYLNGIWEEILYFQTPMNLYPAYGVCVTTDNSPAAGYYTQTFSVRTSQTPVNQGRHLERENTTDAESERIDILGMLLNRCHLECSEIQPVAIQQNKWACAFTLNTGTDDIARSVATDRPFHWSDFAFTFTYNGNAIEGNIVGWAHDIVNTLVFNGLDSNGRYSIGRYVPLTSITTTLEIQPYGHNAFEMIRDEVPYAGDVDLTVKCSRDTTYDYVQWVHDKCYCQPFIISASKTPGSVERYVLVLSQTDAGSITPTAVNQYDDDYFET